MNTPPLHASRDTSQLLVFSAGDWATLAERVKQAVARESMRNAPLDRVALELASRRTEPCRLAIIAADTGDFIDKAEKALHLSAQGRRTLNVAQRIFADRAADEPPKTAFLFPGFGMQYPNMLAGIHARFPVVRSWLDSHGEDDRARWGDNELLFSDAVDPGAKVRLQRESRLRDIWDACLVANLAYFELASDLGLRCDAVVGHSFGENAALVAGGLASGYSPMASLLREITRISRDTARPEPDESEFLAVSGASLERLEREGALPPDVHVVLDNCPQQKVVCGSAATIARLADDIRAHKELSFVLPLLARPVHAPGFPVPLHRLRELYEAVDIQPPRVPVWSCATAAPLPALPDEARGVLSGQWVSRVRFTETVRRLHDDGIRTFIEVGPGANLTGFVRDTLRGEALTVTSMDREGADTLPHLQASLALLWVRGHTVALERLGSVSAAPVVEIGRTPVAHDAAPAAGARGDRVERVLAHVAAILELTDTTLLDPRSGFFELGLSSLGTVELARRLEHELGCVLPPTAGFDYPSPERLADHVASLLAGTATTRATTAAPAADPDEPLAIVGMACRFPGGADDPESFWALLREGKDAVSAVPDGRWPTLASGADREAVRRGAFLADVERFDADFFGLSPREAESLDPQQRLLLEVVWEALERAGVPPRSRTDASATGIFVGISGSDYAQRLNPDERLANGGYLATGTAASTAAGRLSHVLGAGGPALAVDTACSSSLVAVHLARQALRRRECDLAVVAGVGLLLSCELSVYLTAAGALSPGGRCRAFDAGADGYVRGEGCGAVVLERLSDALAARRPILALVRGSAVNHDGHTSGLTVPNGVAQERVVDLALADARVDPDAVSYVEAHGTGTALGDPIELAALGRVFGRGSPQRPPVRVGSVKTNIGHLEAAAGVAGLIKVVLQLQHRELAPNLWFETPNPRVDWTRLPLAVCSRGGPWDTPGRRVAGVSSFGISGTNAHVVLEEAPAPAADENASASGPALLVISARTGPALAQAAGRLADHLERAADLPLCDAAYTLQTGRDHDRRRVSLVARRNDEAAAGLRAIAERVQAARPDVARRRIAFLFTGQGAQHPQMGLQLFASEPVFRQALEACDTLLRAHRSGSLLDVLNRPRDADTHPLDTTEWAQPALFAVGYGLAELWRSWGVEPHAVLGHSVGELTAACVAGVLELEDALTLVASRGELMQSLAPGGMLAVASAAQPVAEALGAELARELAIAAINGPASLVLSGPSSAIGAAEARLRAAGLRTTALNAARAFHSAAMDPILEPLRRLAGSLPHARARIPLVSNLTGAVLDEIADPGAHWARHAREPVRYADGVRALRSAGCNAFVEIGPRPVLIGLAQDGGQSEDEAYLASLHPPREAAQQMLESLGRLYELGVDVDWHAFQAGRGGRSVVLPTYPFQRERWWIEPESAPSPSPRRRRIAHESLLGERLTLPSIGSESRFETELTLEGLGYLAEHRIADRVSLPVSAFVDAALEAAETLDADRAWQLERFVAHLPLRVADREPVLLQTLIGAGAEGVLQCRFYGRRAADDDAPWLLHAEAQVRQRADQTDVRSHAAIVDARETDTIDLARGAFYASCREAGFDYGAHFQVLDELHVGVASARAFATASPAPGERDLPGRRRVRILESALQTLGVLIGSQDDAAGFLLREVARIALWRACDRVEVVARLELHTRDEVRAHVVLLDRDSGAVAGELTGIRYAPAPQPEPARAPEKTAATSVRERLLATVGAGDGEDAVLAYLRETACAILRYPPDRALNPRQPLPEMGFDSIMGVWFRNRLQTDLGVDVEAKHFLRDPTLASLTTSVVSLLAGSRETAVEPGWVRGEL
jgi:acyl transferase domain-containing protein